MESLAESSSTNNLPGSDFSLALFLLLDGQNQQEHQTLEPHFSKYSIQKEGRRKEEHEMAKSDKGKGQR